MRLTNIQGRDWQQRAHPREDEKLDRGGQDIPNAGGRDSRENTE